MKSFFTFLVAAAFILGNAANATEQSVSKPVVIGEELTMYSSVLKEERVLFISKPFNYETSTERYPVLFLLDGGRIFTTPRQQPGFWRETSLRRKCWSSRSAIRTARAT